MFFGLFVSHAGPQSFADRSAGVPQSEPTVVGVSLLHVQIILVDDSTLDVIHDDDAHEARWMVVHAGTGRESHSRYGGAHCQGTQGMLVKV